MNREGCHGCVYALGYWPMYVGDDPRKWGTTRCVRLRRQRRVRVDVGCKHFALVVATTGKVRK